MRICFPFFLLYHGPQPGSSQSQHFSVATEVVTGFEASCLFPSRTRPEKDNLLLIARALLPMKFQGFHIQGDIHHQLHIASFPITFIYKSYSVIMLQGGCDVQAEAMCLSCHLCLRWMSRELQTPINLDTNTDPFINSRYLRKGIAK
jgi:hypothetical protein